jgi:phage shock protein PspC (stress-responsive transcriptional regulator)
MRRPKKRLTQRLTRNMINRVLSGVCGGLGAYLGINAWWVRAAFIGLTLFTYGAGFLLYLVLWLALPQQTLADLTDLPNPLDMSNRARPETLILLGMGVIFVGLLVMAFNLGVVNNTNGGALLPFAVILLGITLLAQQLRSRA